MKIVCPTTAARMTDDILTLLRSDFSTDDGVTFFQGQSLSHLLACLRQRGWKNLGNPNDFQHGVEALGFKAVRARPRMAWGKNPNACKAPCTCITV